MKSLTFILAMDQHNLIGSNNSLPWNMPADLAYFKKQTLNKTILMGRKTCESLPFALPKRKNIVLTRNINFTRKGFEFIHNIESINELNGDLIVIGGALIYKLLMPYAEKILITKIHDEFEGDTYFKWSPEEWKETQREDHKADSKNPHDYSFITYIRA